MLPKVIVAPLVGGVIGYITNDLAIKMLFRPREAVYIGKFHVPFTPGLIPSQQGRIAHSIGGVISSQLLNEDTLRETLLSENAIQTLRKKVLTALRILSKDERKVSDLLRHPAIRSQVNMSLDELEVKLADAVCSKILEANLGYSVVNSLIGDKMNFFTQTMPFSMIMDNKVQENIKEKLAAKLDEIIAEKAPDASRAIVREYRGKLLEARLCDLYAQYPGKEEDIIDKVTDLYVTLLGSNLNKLLSAINIEQIVVNKINDFKPAELEAMIFGIMKRELKAIVYLGALLGFLMGFFNLLL